MGEKATAILKGWLNKDPKRTLNDFFAKDKDNTEFQSLCSDEFTEEAGKSFAALSNKLSRRSKNKAITQQTITQQKTWSWKSEHIKLGGIVLKNYNMWKVDSESFLKNSVTISHQSIQCPKHLYQEAKCGRDVTALSQIYDSIYCLFFYWIGGPSTKRRDESSGLQNLITIFKEADTGDTSKQVEEFVCEQWTFGWKLNKFCTDALEKSSTVFFLPQLAANFVKTSALLRSDNRVEHDRLASSLKTVGILEEVRKNNADEVITNLKELAIRKFGKLDWQSNNRSKANSKSKRRCRDNGDKQRSKRTKVDSTHTSCNRDKHPPEARIPNDQTPLVPQGGDASAITITQSSLQPEHHAARPSISPISPSDPHNNIFYPTTMPSHSNSISQNDNRDETSGTQSCARQGCSLLVCNFCLDNQTFDTVAVHQQFSQQETELIPQQFNVGQQQLDSQRGGFNTDTELIPQQFNVGQQQLDLQRGGFNTDTELIPQQFNVGQQQLDLQRGGFNTDIELIPQQFNQGQQQLDLQRGGFNTDIELIPQQFNQGQQFIQGQQQLIQGQEPQDFNQDQRYLDQEILMKFSSNPINLSTSLTVNG